MIPVIHFFENLFFGLGMGRSRKFCQRGSSFVNVCFLLVFLLLFVNERIQIST